MVDIEENDIFSEPGVDNDYNETLDTVTNTVDNIDNKQSTGKKKYVCPYCGAEFDKSIDYARHIRLEHPEHTKPKQKPKPQPITYEPDEEEDEGPLPSPQEELERWFIKQLENKLPYAIPSKKVPIIIETLEEDPDMIWTPARLETHIRQLAGAKINDYMLSWILSSLYSKLNERSMELQKTSGIMLPSIAPPRGPGNIINPNITQPREPRYQYFEQKPGYFERRTYPPYEPAPRHEMPPSYYPTPRPTYDTFHNREDDTTKILILKLLDKVLEDKEKQPKPAQKPSEPMVEIPNPFGSGTMKVPASQAPIYLMMKSIQDELQALANVITSKNEEPKSTEPPKVKLPDGTELPADQAVYYIQMIQEKEKRALLEQRLRSMENQMQQLYQNLSPERLAKVVEELGFQKSGSPTLDLLNKTRQDLNKMIDRMMTIIEIQAKRGVSPLPPFGQAHYTPEEREQKLRQLKETLSKAEEIATLENKIATVVDEHGENLTKTPKK